MRALAAGLGITACAASTLLAAACGNSPPPKAAHVEPPIGRLHFDNDFGLIFVTVLVGDTPHEFILDSGAGHTVLGTDIGSGAPLNVGGVVFAPQDVAVRPLHDLERFVGRKVEGLLGSELLEHYVVTVDYAAQEVLFYRPDYLPVGGTPLPVRIANDQAFVDTTLGDGTHTATASLEIDTGSMTAVGLTAPFIAQHHLLESARKIATTGVGLGGTSQGFLARLASIRLGSTTLGPLVIEWTDDRLPRADDGTLGAELLSQFTVTFDYPHQLLRLAAREHPPFLGVDGSGLSVATFADDLSRCQILAVAAGSPAANTGIEVGDEIVAVGEIPFAQLGLAQLWSLLRQQGTLRLTIRHAGEDRAVALALRPLL